MVYTAAGFTNPLGRVPDSIKSKVSYWWIANYGVTAPLLPLGLSGWTFWQFASSGEARVIAPNDSGKLETDLNYFNGSENDLRAMAGLDAEEPPPDTGETMAKYKVTVTWDQGARERQYPHATGIYDVILADNTVHYADADPVPDMDDPSNPDKQWIKLQSGWYIATRYPSGSGIVKRANVELMDPADPPPEIGRAH